MMSVIAVEALRALPTHVDDRDIVWHVAVVVDDDGAEVDTVAVSDLGPSVTSAIIDCDA